MKRRDFLAGLGGAAAAWPLAARAQQASEAADHRAACLGHAGNPWPWFAASLQRLHELGWIEGRTVMVEHRWAEGRDERFAEIMAEFVKMKVDVIVTTGATLLPAKQVTSVIPIVFAIAADPVGSGLVASLAQSGRQRHRPVASTGRCGWQASRNFARGFFPVFAGWRSWPTSAVRVPRSRYARLKQQPARSALRPSHWKSGEQKISRRPSRRSRAWRRHFTSWATRSWSPIGCASIFRPSRRDYRRIAISGSSSKREV